jgi:hypothetical protein
VLANLTIEDGRRWGDVADPKQVQDARDLLDLDNPRPYHFLLRARGWSKSSDLAGVLLAVMLVQAPPGSKLYALAADRDQGRLISDTIRGYVQRDTVLRLDKLVKVGNYRVDIPSRAVGLEIIAADLAGTWGLKPYFLVMDEVAQWQSGQRTQDLWTAAMTAMHKVADSRMAAITSAGDPAHWSHKKWLHALEDPMWQTHSISGPPPWADEARLEEQRAQLLPSEWARLYLNQWTASEDRLATWDDIVACCRETASSLPPSVEHSYVIGLDFAFKIDRTVATVLHVETGDEALEGANRVVLDHIEVWQGSPESPVVQQEVEEWLRKTAAEYHYARMVFDPSQTAGMAQRLRAEFEVEEVVFTVPAITKMAQVLLVLLRDHRLSMPRDAELMEELSNVRLKTIGPGIYRIDHDPSRHDDRAVALALTAVKALERPVYDWAKAYGMERCSKCRVLMTAEQLDRGHYCKGK